MAHLLTLKDKFLCIAAYVARLLVGFLYSTDVRPTVFGVPAVGVDPIVGVGPVEAVDVVKFLRVVAILVESSCSFPSVCLPDLDSNSGHQQVHYSVVHHLVVANHYSRWRHHHHTWHP